MKTYTLTEVPRYGWLCRIERDGVEVYRGEFQPCYEDAMMKARQWEAERGEI